MNALEYASQAIAVLAQAIPVTERLVRLLKKLRFRLPWSRRFSYENQLLDLSLDIRDTEGKRAMVTRHQRVRFLNEEAGVLTSPIWGEGERMLRYAVSGGKRLGSRPEGSKQVLLLGLDRRPRPDQVVTLQAERVIENGFRGSKEYFETEVERPTRLLRLSILFPAGRPPKQVYASSSLASFREPRLRVRFRPDGRATLSWRLKAPTLNTRYGLRWVW